GWGTKAAYAIVADITPCDASPAIQVLPRGPRVDPGDARHVRRPRRSRHPSVSARPRSSTRSSARSSAGSSAGSFAGSFAGQRTGGPGGDRQAEDQARRDDEVRDPLVDPLGREQSLLAEVADRQDQVERVEERVEVRVVVLVQDGGLLQGEDDRPEGEQADQPARGAERAVAV